MVIDTLPPDGVPVATIYINPAASSSFFSRNSAVSLKIDYFLRR
jgi:hypothetical protein